MVLSGSDSALSNLSAEKKSEKRKKKEITAHNPPPLPSFPPPCMMQNRTSASAKHLLPYTNGTLGTAPHHGPKVHVCSLCTLRYVSHFLELVQIRGHDFRAAFRFKPLGLPPPTWVSFTVWAAAVPAVSHTITG